MSKINKSDLGKILVSHKLWIETNGKQGNRADLFTANLMGADLEGAILSCANLTGANLFDADLTGANLTGANLFGANLTGANLTGAILTGAILMGAILRDAIGLPDVSWIKESCLVQLNNVRCDFLSEKTRKWVNFVQDGFGLILKLNPEEETFDILISDQIFRDIPDWVKYSGIKKISPA